MGGGDLHVQVRVAHGVADLVVGAPGAEHGERARERDVAGQRETRGHVDHVLLGDAAVEQAPGVSRVGELLGGGRAGQVGVHGHDGHALSRRARRASRRTRRAWPSSGQRVSVFAQFHHDGPPIPRRRTAPPEPSQVPRRFGALPCQPAWFSMKETPLPFTVRAITHTGRAVSAASALMRPKTLDERGDVVAVRRAARPSRRRRTSRPNPPDRTRRGCSRRSAGSLLSMMATRRPSF